MNPALLTTVGRILVIGAIGLLFLAYMNFVPTALSSDHVADYVKNHFVREIIFGIGLAAWTIRVALAPIDSANCVQITVLGSIVVLPFWLAALMGWSVGGMEEVWGGSIGPGAAYLLHGSQVLMFYMGLALLWVGRDEGAR
jgi:hypothetical protein